MEREKDGGVVGEPSGQHSGDARRAGNRVVAISGTMTTNSGQVEVRKSSEGSER